MLAFVWDYSSHAFEHEILEGFDRKVIDDVNSHNRLVYRKLEGSLETLETMIWKSFDSDNIVISFTPSDHPSIKTHKRRKSLLDSAAEGLMVGVSRGTTAAVGTSVCLRGESWMSTPLIPQMQRRYSQLRRRF